MKPKVLLCASLCVLCASALKPSLLILSASGAEHLQPTRFPSPIELAVSKDGAASSPSAKAPTK